MPVRRCVCREHQPWLALGTLAVVTVFVALVSEVLFVGVLVLMVYVIFAMSLYLLPPAA